MLEWFKKKDLSREITAKKDEVSLLTSFNEKFKEYKDILTSFSKQDTQTFKDIDEIVKSLEKYLDAVKDIKQLKEYDRLIKVYDKKLEKAKVALETLNDIDVAPKKQQKAEQQVAEVLGEEPEESKVEETSKEELNKEEDNTKNIGEIIKPSKEEDKQEGFMEAAALKENLLKKNASEEVSVDTDKLKTKSEEDKKEVAEAFKSGDSTKIEQVVKEKGVEKTSSYNLFLQQCFSRSAERDIDKVFEESLSNGDDFLTMLNKLQDIAEVEKLVENI